jgi:hypothetical protein
LRRCVFEFSLLLKLHAVSSPVTLKDSPCFVQKEMLKFVFGRNLQTFGFWSFSLETVQKRCPFDVHLSRVVAPGLHYIGQLENDKNLFLFFSKCKFSTTLEIGVGRGGDGVAVLNLLLFPFFFCKMLGLQSTLSIIFAWVVLLW